MRINSYRHIFFLGIGGIGMSALARFCLRRGIRVSGYDRQSGPLTDELQAEGGELIFQDDPAALTGTPDLVIYTPAIPAESALMMHFRDNQVPMIKRSEALGWVTDGIDTIAVAGTHGKTTTSSMISYLLHAAGIRHTALLGGISANYRSNYLSEGPDLVVTEADEYDRSFHRLFPRYAVVTAMDPDHLDIYGTEEAMLDAYRQFIRQIQPGGILLYRHGLEEQMGGELLTELADRQVSIFSYGLEDGNYTTRQLHVAEGQWHWELVTPTGSVPGLTLAMAGRHNVLNATAAAAMALQIGATPVDLQHGMPRYKGVSRRFEVRYRQAGYVLIDDYAHHPEELAAAIRAARDTYGSPVTGIFQPHLYSRTRDLAAGFAEALDTLDVPVITDIYPAREEPIPGVSSHTIYALMRNPNRQYLPGATWVDWMVENKPRTLIILGAGDLDKHIPELIRRMYTT